MEPDKPKCTVRGSLKGGRAMCPYIVVGGVFCGVKQGECELQVGANGSAVPVLQDTDTGAKPE